MSKEETLDALIIETNSQIKRHYKELSILQANDIISGRYLYHSNQVEVWNFVMSFINDYLCATSGKPTSHEDDLPQTRK